VRENGQSVVSGARSVTLQDVRLSPPTTGTFTLAIVAGVGIRLDWVDILTGYDFWLVRAAPCC